MTTLPSVPVDVAPAAGVEPPSAPAGDPLDPLGTQSPPNHSSGETQ
ncbi:hypothetical protein [Microbispora bryophytorum]